MAALRVFVVLLTFDMPLFNEQGTMKTNKFAPACICGTISAWGLGIKVYLHFTSQGHVLPIPPVHFFMAEEIATCTNSHALALA